jgi:hypothetical protein
MFQLSRTYHKTHFSIALTVNNHKYSGVENVAIMPDSYAVVEISCIGTYQEFAYVNYS